MVDSSRVPKFLRLYPVAHCVFLNTSGHNLNLLEREIVNEYVHQLKYIHHAKSSWLSNPPSYHKYPIFPFESSVSGPVPQDAEKDRSQQNLAL